MEFQSCIRQKFCVSKKNINKQTKSPGKKKGWELCTTGILLLPSHSFPPIKDVETVKVYKATVTAICM